MINDHVFSLQLVTTLLLLLPFTGFPVLLGVGKRLAGPLAVCLTGGGLLLSGWLAMHMPEAPVALSTSWAGLTGWNLPFSLRIDTLTVMMLLVVHFVALLVQLYSISYLHNEPERHPRYFAYLQLFVGAMLGIVLAGNLIVLYAFWELVGLASYLLIGFWTFKPQASKAATKAFLMNRIGDAGFLIGILMTYRLLHTTEFSLLTGEAGITQLPAWVGLCLFMGCVGKSAQFPLLTWLPDAMEGPTPVSALLHAATMVAAGIFLLARIHPLLPPDALMVVAVVGTITALWGGYSALFQNDIKKVLAFSTVSQLGLMVAGMGTGNVSGALFHLLTHAFFKAGLFLSAGAVIHAVHTQDMREMGGLRKALPSTFAVYAICTAALAGLPFFSGFLSKEAILSGAFAWAGEQGSGIAWLIPVTLLLSSGLTALYMARQLQLVFGGDGRYTVPHVHGPDARMRIPLFLLAALSLFIGFSVNPLSAHGSWFFALFGAEEAEGPVWLAPASLLLALAGGWVGYRYAPGWITQTAPPSVWVRLSVEYGFLDRFYHWLIIAPVEHLAALTKQHDEAVAKEQAAPKSSHVIRSVYHAERGIVDGLVRGLGVGTVVLAHIVHAFDRLIIDGIVNGAVWLAAQTGQMVRSVQNGRIQSYVTAAVVGLLALLWWLL
ncbi:NADH-quinone oxidoreductase subunit 5 family protein [Arsenicibacter rosenii]|uniref:NADH-quinone oxidoreductase subunit M n=1 Tax=Arsenicibacter rosenii TaxID=1750698 RepID=A0A1S2VRG5_9BACT|nr:NADH-quinone oxidoreductase subunit L [Arsenicibacter rosenii]OIN60438.1 NADH-quinone oxidoreductase subunit M [Arsenicibacter rosenii]